MQPDHVFPGVLAGNFGEIKVIKQPGNSGLLDHIRKVLEIWTHNRKLYPGWLVFPSGQERSDLSHRTGDWEPPILSAFPHFTPVAGRAAESYS